MNQLDSAYKELGAEDLIPSTEVISEGLGYFMLLKTMGGWPCEWCPRVMEDRAGGRRMLGR